jgi:hypothetical protein
VTRNSDTVLPYVKGDSLECQMVDGLLGGYSGDYKADDR